MTSVLRVTGQQIREAEGLAVGRLVRAVRIETPDVPTTLNIVAHVGSHTKNAQFYEVNAVCST